MIALELLACAWAASWLAIASIAVRSLGVRTGWTYAGVQLVNWIAVPLGWVLLIPFCLARAWTVPPDSRSLKPLTTPVARTLVDRWKWLPLDTVYGNPEDGVSGAWAFVWAGWPAKLVPYMPIPAWLPWSLTWAWEAWRAYLWSAWRNSAGGLKYVFELPGEGPIVTGTWLGGRRPYALGWKLENGFNVPVLSL